MLMYTAQEWIKIVIEKIYEVTTVGRKPTKIIIPFAVQYLMSTSFMLRESSDEEKQPKSITTFYGYPVEDGDEVLVIHEEGINGKD